MLKLMDTNQLVKTQLRIAAPTTEYRNAVKPHQIATINGSKTMIFPIFPNQKLSFDLPPAQKTLTINKLTGYVKDFKTRI
jgi:hypothetical protein